MLRYKIRYVNKKTFSFNYKNYIPSTHIVWYRVGMHAYKATGFKPNLIRTVSKKGERKKEARKQGRKEGRKDLEWNGKLDAYLISIVYLLQHHS